MRKIGEINLLRGKRGRERADGKGRQKEHDHPSDIADFVRLRKDDASRQRRAEAVRTAERAAGAANIRERIVVQREEAERQREIDAFWRRFLRKLPRQRKPSGGDAPTKQRIGGALLRSRQLPAYTKHLVDRLGRRGIYLALRYLSAKTAGRGVARRLVGYAFKRDHVEFDEFFDKLWVSNVGDDEHEIASGFDLMETANRAARRNAKVVYHMIVQLPHDLPPQQRLEIVRRYCALRFGSHDLPFLAVLHEPSAEGNQRNFHAHILFSFRPMVRCGAYEWNVGQALRRDLDNPTSMQSMRIDFAAVMTDAMQAAGRTIEYTGLSHAARGLKCRPTEHLGAQKTREVRGGHYVAANARNAQRVAINETIVEVERLGRRQKELESALANLPRAATSPPRAARPSRQYATRIPPTRRRDPARHRAGQVPAPGLDVLIQPKQGSQQAPPRSAVPATRSLAASRMADKAPVAAISLRTPAPVGQTKQPSLSLLHTPHPDPGSKIATVIEPIMRGKDQALTLGVVTALAIAGVKIAWPARSVGTIPKAITISFNAPSKPTMPVEARRDNQERVPSVSQLAVTTIEQLELGDAGREGLTPRYADRSTTRIAVRIASSPVYTRHPTIASRTAAIAPILVQRIARTQQQPVALSMRSGGIAEPRAVSRARMLAVTRRSAIDETLHSKTSVWPSRAPLVRPATEVLELEPTHLLTHGAKENLRRKAAEEAEARRQQDAAIVRQGEDERRRAATERDRLAIMASTISPPAKSKRTRSDGFGGITTDPVRVHQVPQQPVQTTAAFDADFEPSPELLSALAAARANAWSIHVAIDGKLTTDADAPDNLRVAIHVWRQDGDVGSLVREVVERARVGSERPWPVTIAGRMSAFLRANPSADPDRQLGNRNPQASSFER